MTTSANLTTYTSQELKDWANRAAAHIDEKSKPFTPDDSRIAYMKEHGRIPKSDRPPTDEELAFWIENEPEHIGWHYFIHFAAKPENPPIPIPDWAEVAEYLWGDLVDLEITFKSEPVVTSTVTVHFEQFASIKLREDDHHPEIVDDQKVGVLYMHDRTLEIQAHGDVFTPSNDEVIEISDALRDLVMMVEREPKNKLRRRTEAGEPDFAGIGGGL